MRLLGAAPLRRTLVPTLVTKGANGDLPTYTHGKSHPSWARRDRFHISDRVVRLPLPFMSVRTALRKKEDRSILQRIDLSPLKKH